MNAERDKPTIINAVRLEDLKVGDRVWIQHGTKGWWGTVFSVSPDGVLVDRDGWDIRWRVSLAYLFYGPPTITGPERPKRKVKKWLTAFLSKDHGRGWYMGNEDTGPRTHKDVIYYGPFEVEVEE